MTVIGFVKRLTKIINIYCSVLLYSYTDTKLTFSMNLQIMWFL